MYRITKSLLLMGMLLTLSSASTITLNQILHASDAHNAVSHALEQDLLAQEAKNMADTSPEPYAFYAEVTKAKPEWGGDGDEYTIGISKNIKLGNIQIQEQKSTRLFNQANRLEAQNSIVNFRNRLKNLYHQYCIDVQNYGSFKQSYDDLIRLYHKKQKAYTYQDISKRELMQIESEKNRLYAQLQEMKMMQSITKEKLYSLSKIGYSPNSQFLCRDIYPIRNTVKLRDTFTLSKEAQEKRLSGMKERMKRYSHSFESVNVSAQYGKELDTDKYTLGVSIPLTFSTKRSEYEKAAAMYKHTALQYEYEQTMREKKSTLHALEATLQSQALMVKTLSKNHRSYKENLLPLVKKSYILGETSVIEYLLNRQKFYTLNQELYTAKKAYYNTLFALYTLSEIKDTP